MMHPFSLENMGYVVDTPVLITNDNPYAFAEEVLSLYPQQSQFDVLHQIEKNIARSLNKIERLFA